MHIHTHVHTDRHLYFMEERAEDRNNKDRDLLKELVIHNKGLNSIS